MQTILRITSIRYRWLLGLLTLRVLIDGFNVLISMLIQLGLTVALSGQVNLLVAIFAGMLAAAVVYTGIYFLSGVVTERLKRRVSGDIATALMANFLQDDATQVPDNGTATNLIVTDTQHIMQFLDAGVLPMVDFGITVFLGVIYVVTAVYLPVFRGACFVNKIKRKRLLFKLMTNTKRFSMIFWQMSLWFAI